jgi:hypothetical protein
MDVRLARPTDAPLVLALALDDSSHLVKPADWAPASSTAHTLFRSSLPVAFAGRTWVTRGPRHIGLLEAQPRQYVIGWDVVRLAVRGDRPAALSALVGAAVAHLQSRSVPRLFARCEADVSAELREVAFQPLARECVLVGQSLCGSEHTPPPVESRYRMPQDAWPLHQLESLVTPAMVRQIEGLTSLDWSRRTRGMSEIVVESDGRVVGWVGWDGRSNAAVSQIGLMVDPQHGDLGRELLQHVLSQLPPDRKCVARVREYQTEALAAFTDAGFTVAREEVLMVRHAQVEYARSAQRGMRVVRVPSVGSFNVNFVRCDLPLPSATSAVERAMTNKEVLQ